MALPSATSPTPHRGLLTGEGDGSLAVVLHPLSKHSCSSTWHFPLVPISRHSYLWPLTFDVHWLTSCLFFLFLYFLAGSQHILLLFSPFFLLFLNFPPLLFTTFNFNKLFAHSSYFLPQLPGVFIPPFFILIFSSINILPLFHHHVLRFNNLFNPILFHPHCSSPLFFLWYWFCITFFPSLYAWKFLITPSLLYIQLSSSFTPLVLFFLSSWDTSLPSVHPMTSSSAAYSQFMLQFRCWLPWIQPHWTGNGKRQSHLQTPLPQGGQSADQWFLLPLKLRLRHGKSGTLLAQVCFTSFA